MFGVDFQDLVHNVSLNQTSQHNLAHKKEQICDDDLHEINSG